MKITAQEEYGLRCLLQLARSEHGKVVSVKEIAAKEGLSRAYVEKLLRLLAKSDLVHSVRGINGGYVLNRQPYQINMAEVVRALGGMPVVEQICDDHTGTQASCMHVDNCGLRSVWSNLTQYMDQFLEATFLSSLLHDEAEVAQQISRQSGIERHEV